MKILFIHAPNYLDIGIVGGIATLSAILKEKGHNVELFDTTFMKTKDTLDFWHRNSGGLMQFKKTEYTLKDLVKDDPTVDIYEEFQKKIDKFNPDIIAISAMTTTFDRACDLVRNVKHDAMVISGGVHSTIAPDDAIAQSIIDAVCVGEADNIFPELASLIETGKDHTGVKSMWFRLKNNKIKKNLVASRVALNDLPTPDWGFFDKRHLFRPYQGKIYVGSFFQQSRGCPNQCTYCVDPALSRISEDGSPRGFFRINNPSVTIKHIRELKEKLGVNFLRFGDDTFFLPDIDHIKELHRGIKPLNIKFTCSVYHSTISEEKIEIAKDMGLVAVSVGIESGSPKIRKILKRNYSDETVIKNIELLNKYGLRLSTTNLIGSPEETREDVFKTIELNRKVEATGCSVFVVFPYPGTQIQKDYNIPIRDKNGRIMPLLEAANFELSKMTSQEVVGLLNTFNLYQRYSKKLWPIIKIAESPDELGASVLMVLHEITSSLLSDEIIRMKPLNNILKDRKLKFNYTVNADIDIPEFFSKLFDLPLDAGSFDIIMNALKDRYSEKEASDNKESWI